jgi:hypothetical protein
MRARHTTLAHGFAESQPDEAAEQRSNSTGALQQDRQRIAKKRLYGTSMASMALWLEEHVRGLLCIASSTRVSSA